MIESSGSVQVSSAEAQIAAKENVDFLGSLCAPDDCEQPFSTFHHALFQLLMLESVKDRSFEKFAIGVPRGHAKTFLIKLWIVALILFTNHRFILVVGSTKALAEAIISDVCDMLDSPNIQLLFGNWRAAITRDTLDKKVFSFKNRDIVLKAIGAGSSVRGINEKKLRPDVIIMDDMQSREDAESIDLGIKLLTWMNSTLLKAGSPKGCLSVYIGNMYPDLQDDKGRYACILRNLQKNSKWKSLITGAILADGSALWEAVHPLSRLLDQLEEDISLGLIESFYSELMNDPQCGASLLNIDVRKIHQEAYQEDICTGKFIIIDLATDKPTPDQAYIGLFSLQGGIPVLIDKISGKFNPSQIISEALQLAMNNGASLIAVEDTAFQYTMLHWFNLAIEQLGVEGITMVGVSGKGVRKNARIGLMLRALVTKRIGISPVLHSEILSKILQFNPKKTDNLDDALDVLAYAEQVVQEFGEYITLLIEQSQMFSLEQEGSSSLDSLCF